MIGDDWHAALIRKLDGLALLDSSARDAVRSLPVTMLAVPANHYLLRESETPTRCCVLVEGCAFRHKTLPGGGRQIVSIHLPGDILDLHHLWLPRSDYNVQTSTKSVVALVPDQALRELITDFRSISEALWRDTLIDAAVTREWTLNIGRREGKARIAHLLCELGTRLQAASLGAADHFELPMTQDQLADATGLTAVHVNRMLTELTRERMLVRRHREIKIVNLAGFRRLADFDPNYLRLSE